MIPLLVVVTAVVVGAILVLGREAVSSDAEPLDVERQEQWLVAHSPSWLQGVLRRLGSRVVGGVAVGVVFVALFVAALIVGSIFSTVDEDGGFGGWDSAAAEFGARNATDTSTWILDMVTRLGGTLYLLVGMTLLGLYHGIRRRNWGPGIYLAVVGVGISLLNNGLKLIVDRDRPDIAQLAGHAGSSFPSGHSAAAAACWAGIALVLARSSGRTARLTLSLVAATIALAVAATRVLLGVHWLSDVVAGVIVGWTWFFVVTVVFGGRLMKFGEPLDRVANDRSETTPVSDTDVAADRSGAEPADTKVTT